MAIRKCEFCKAVWSEELMFHYSVEEENKPGERKICVCCDCNEHFIKSMCKKCNNRGFNRICMYCTNLNMFVSRERK